MTSRTVLRMVCLLAVLLYTCGRLHAEVVEMGVGNGPPKDNPFVKSYGGWSIRAFTEVPILKLDLKHKTRIGDDISYEPNITLNTGLGATYGNFVLSIGMALPFTAGDTDIYGETRAQAFKFASFFERFGLDASIQHYQGFYLNNPETFNGDWKHNEPYPQQPNMRLTVLGLNLYYIHSERFSLNAGMKLTEKQLKSSGSFLLALSQSFLNLENDGTLIPDYYAAQYGSENGFSGGSYHATTIAPGYGATYCRGNLFLFGSFFFGGGVNYGNYTASSESRSRTGTAMKINLKGSVGYNSDTWYGGATFAGDSFSYEMEVFEMSTWSMFVNIFFGIRL